MEPLDIRSFEPPTARKFVWRQMELMEEQGLSQREAFIAVEKEMVVAR